jgi:NAD(P) transhydrogenase subunit alpha
MSTTPIGADRTAAAYRPADRAPILRRPEALETPMHPIDFWSMTFVFMLATFVGFDVIRNVSRLLHTPLMSLTNAISAIAVVGSIIIAGEQKTTFSTVLGTIAVAASVTNIVSGFLITDRMLKMFRQQSGKR